MSAGNGGAALVCRNVWKLFGPGSAGWLAARRAQPPSLEDDDERETHFKSFGRLFAKSENKQLAAYGRKLGKDLDKDVLERAIKDLPFKTPSEPK